MKTAVGRRLLIPALLAQIVLGIAVNITAVLGFFYVTRQVFNNETLGFDEAIVDFVYSWRTPWLNEIMQAVTLFGGVGLLATAVFIAFVLSVYRSNRRSLAFLSLFLSGAAINLLLKAIFQRPRPDLLPLVNETTYSYPSGHAMNSFIFYFAVAHLFYRYTGDRTLGIVMAVAMGIWVFLIGLSRVYLGAHYPSDVIAGFFGGLWWLVTFLIIEKVFAAEHLIVKRKD